MKLKKLITLLSVCVLAVIAAVGCKNSDTEEATTKEAASIVGTWKVNLDEMEGAEDAEDMEDAGISFNLDILYTFEDDGTGSVTALGMTVDFEYAIEGNKLSLTMTVDGETETESGTFKLEGDKLTLYTEGDEEDVTVLERVK